MGENRIETYFHEMSFGKDKAWRPETIEQQIEFVRITCSAIVRSLAQMETTPWFICGCDEKDYDSFKFIMSLTDSINVMVVMAKAIPVELTFLESMTASISTFTTLLVNGQIKLKLR